MPTGFDRSPVAGVERLDRVRRAQHGADLDVVVQERDELIPGVVPQLGDHRVAPAPGVGELVERLPRGRRVDRGVDRSDRSFDRIPVPPAGEPERVADQMDDAGLNDRLRPHVGDHMGQALQPVTDDEEHVTHATVAPWHTCQPGRRGHRRRQPAADLRRGPTHRELVGNHPTQPDVGDEPMRLGAAPANVRLVVRGPRLIAAVGLAVAEISRYTLWKLLPIRAAISFTGSPRANPSAISIRSSWLDRGC